MQAQLEQEASKAKALESALQQAVSAQGQQQQELLRAKATIQTLRSEAANASDSKLATENASLKVRRILLQSDGTHAVKSRPPTAHSSAAPLES